LRIGQIPHPEEAVALHADHLVVEFFPDGERTAGLFHAQSRDTGRVGHPRCREQRPRQNLLFSRRLCALCRDFGCPPGLLQLSQIDVCVHPGLKRGRTRAEAEYLLAKSAIRSNSAENAVRPRQNRPAVTDEVLREHGERPDRGAQGRIVALSRDAGGFLAVADIIDRGASGETSHDTIDADEHRHGPAIAKLLDDGAAQILRQTITPVPVPGGARRAFAHGRVELPDCARRLSDGAAPKCR
jgi:hypothetical protein